MPHTRSAGAAIYYETSGNPADQPVVLIAGTGGQLIVWHDGFVDRLISRGMFVIRLDNRDVGLSEKMGGPDDLGAAYTLSDMADDVCRVLDALGIQSAHVVGQSLGGAITQTLATNHPRRVRSMVLIYTTPSFDDRYITEEVRKGILEAPRPAPASRAETIARFVEGQRHFAGSSGYAFDEEWMRELAGRSYDRCDRPDGVARQIAMVSASGDRSAGLSALSIPAAIIHGRADSLVRIEAAFELDRQIKDAELHLYPGMGHRIVEPLWDDFAAIIARTAGRASAVEPS